MKQRFLQTPFWAEFKAAHGWKTEYVAMHADGSLEPFSSGQLEAYSTKSSGTRLAGLPADSRGPAEAQERPEPLFSDSTVLAVLVRSFSVAKIKRFSLAYIPMAPEFNVPSAGTGLLSSQKANAPAEGESNKESSSAYTEKIADSLCAIARGLAPHLPADTLFIRFDPPVDFPSPGERDAFAKELVSCARANSLPLYRSPVSVQPPDTTLLDLSKTEEELLSCMKNKWRYNIRLAAKKGVQVTRHYGTDSDFEEAFNTFYGLFMQTSERDGVSFHEREYYHDLLQRGAPANSPMENGGQENTKDGRGASALQAPKKADPLLTLYLARHDGEALAGIITLFCGREAVYLYGASGNSKRNLMPAYLLQWTAIQDAKTYGAPVYDFYGMPPTADEGHPMHGLYQFKTGFGGQNTHRIGSWDVPLKPAMYRLYLAAEKFRAWWHKSLRKKIIGR